MVEPTKPTTKSSTLAVEVPVGSHVVRVSHPDRIYFPARGETKLDPRQLLPLGR